MSEESGTFVRRSISLGPDADGPTLEVERAAGFVTKPLAKQALRRLHDRFVADPATTDLSALRPVIARSWLRSRACNVSPGIPFNHEVREPRLDEQVLRCAAPVLAELEQHCLGTGGYVTLTDPLGTLAVFRGERSAARWVEDLFPLIGASAVEEITGTNSEGTTLEEGFGVQVWGAEHFAEMLQDACCTSVPIRDPLRQSVRAVLTLTLPERVASYSHPRAIGLIVQGAAAEVARSLAIQLTAREQALLDAYLREVRKRGTDAVVAMDDRTTIASRGAMRLLDQSDYAVLGGYAREAERLGRPVERDVTIEPGRMLHLDIRPVMVENRDAVGSTMRLRKARPALVPSRTAQPAGRTDLFPSLVGESRALRRALDVASTAVQRQVPAYVVGEPGTGKRHLAEEMLIRLSDRTLSLDCEDGALAGAGDLERVEAHLRGGGAVMLHRVDSVPPELQAELAEAVTALDQPLLVLTVRRQTDEVMELTAALRAIEVRMPALRRRRDDIPLLAAQFIKDVPNGRARASSRLLELLTEADWPGNVRELREVVTSAAQRSTSVEIGVDDLAPAHRNVVMHQPLSRLEEAELQAIRDALVDTDGNRAKTADLLQMGRSTLYRRIRMYTRRGFDLGLRPEP